MSRISRHMMFMGIAELAARRSTCFRRSVGAVLVADNNVISIGYNGPSAGEPHCTGLTCPTDGVCSRSDHAEKNLMRRVPFHLFGKGLVCDAYVTESPCPGCAEFMDGHNPGTLRAVYYLHEYRIKEGIDCLIKKGIDVFRMTAAGMVINYKTGELVDGEGI